MGRAGVDDELRNARLLALRELGAVPRRGHLVLCADKNERRDREGRAGDVGARGVKSRRRLETSRAAGRDLERRIATLGKPDRRDPGRINVRKT